MVGIVVNRASERAEGRKWGRSVRGELRREDEVVRSVGDGSSAEFVCFLVWVES